MPVPLSADIRRRVVEAYEAGEGGHLRLSRRFSVSICSVRRWVARHKKEQTLLPKPHAGGVPPKITNEELPELFELVREKSDRTVQELTDEWNTRKGTNFHRSSMIRALMRAGLTSKKRLSGP